MLVSHRKQFIFTKTVKTAGTSVEVYFERYCMFEGEWESSHTRNEYVSKAGIIGYRGSDPTGTTWRNHMSAYKIRELVGEYIWNRYFKFTVIRNPFDKLISAFYFLESQNKISMEGKTAIERFRHWICNGGMAIDRDMYLIAGKECMDYFIRFESLHKDIEQVCNRLSIPFSSSLVPELKKGVRKHDFTVSDYYDPESRQIVEEKYAWELKRFGYGLPE